MSNTKTITCNNIVKITTILIIVNFITLVHGASKVPCYFIFGDSLLDNGNNNNLNTQAKANYPPYGIDFPNGPTGRFTNGRNMADILGLFSIFDISINFISRLERSIKEKSFFILLLEPKTFY